MLGGVVLARIKGEELPWGWSSTVGAPSLCLTPSPTMNRKLNTVHIPLQMAHLLAWGYKVFCWLIWGKENMIAVIEWIIITCINIYNKEAVIQRRTLTYGTANKGSPDVTVSMPASYYGYLRFESRFERSSFPSKQILGQYLGRVQIFGNDVNRSKFYSGRN